MDIEYWIMIYLPMWFWYTCLSVAIDVSITVYISMTIDKNIFLRTNIVIRNIDSYRQLSIFLCSPVLASASIEQFAFCGLRRLSRLLDDDCCASAVHVKCIRLRRSWICVFALWTIIESGFSRRAHWFYWIFFMLSVILSVSQWMIS